jgi:flagellar basal-body rod protein FlgC
MNLFGVIETSGSAMQAERIRAEVVAANMANAETTRTSSGQPYRRHMVVFEENSAPLGFQDALGKASQKDGATIPERSTGSDSPGVRVAAVVEDLSPPLLRYDPGHPDADTNGYVAYPNINPVTEMVDLLGATRAYGLNGSAVQAEKGMITAALDLART